MATVEVNGVEGMQELLGQEIGPSEWRTVTQEDINTFAELSGDDQWIHVDVERAKTESPFGTTIAHGNLTLSLVDGFRTALISSTGFALGVNYGWNKIRFPAPVPVDVEDLASVDHVFATLGKHWGSFDFLVHAVAYSDKNELKGRYAETTRDNFTRTMVISCFSFTEVAKRAAPLMRDGGSMITLTYGGSTRVMPNYNVMGVAKAALEASVRYLASDYGPQGIRVNAISAGPIRTLAGAGITDARLMFNYQKRHAPLRRTVSIEEVGGSALYLLSDLSSGVTGEVHFVDSGYNIISMPHPDALKVQEAAEEGADGVQVAAAE